MNRSLNPGTFCYGIERYTNYRSTKMKVTSSIKRKGVVRVVCSRNPRHKQKQG